MMNTTYHLTVLCAFAFWPGDALADQKIYLEATKTAELIAKEGQKIVVHGVTTGSGKSASGTNFVNFKEAEFFLVTFKTDLVQFKEGEPHLIYDGKRLAVEGTISVYQGKPQIKLTSPDQIIVLKPDAVFPPPAKTEMKDTGPDETKTKEPVPSDKPATETPVRKPPVDPSEYFKN